MDQETKSSGIVLGIIKKLREEVSGELPMQVAELLLQIALNPGCNQRDLVVKTNTSRSGVSRNVAILSQEWGRGWITYREDPNDRRSKLHYLSPKGKLLMDKLVIIVEEGKSNADTIDRKPVPGRPSAWR